MCMTFPKAGVMEMACEAQCSATDGLALSAAYPCRCGVTTCITGELRNITINFCSDALPESDPSVLNFFIRMLQLIVVALILLIAVAFRRFWWPPLYKATCANFKCPMAKNLPVCGWLLSHLCPCCMSKFHPHFRLRIVIHSAWGLRQTDILEQMQAYVKVICGTNPLKYTSVKTVPYNYQNKPVMWDDIIDLMVSPSDDYVRLVVMDHDQIGEADEVGEARLPIAEFYARLREEDEFHCCHMPCYFGEGVRSIENENMTLLYGENNTAAGMMKVSLYACDRNTQLPRIQPGLHAAATQKAPEEKPLLSEMLSTVFFLK